jgi:carbon monoxide dehydrogenase subunit G
MKMTGEQRIAASRQRVWDALNDPEILKQCIPGCQSLEKESAERMKATVAIKVGPIGARFAGAVTLSDLDPPNGYLITGEGQGGAAGFAKGGAKVKLVDDASGTLLSYEVDAQVGGRLAQLGGAIIDATAKQLAGQFFKKFGEAVAAPAQTAAAPSAAAAAGPSPVSSAQPLADVPPPSASAPPQAAMTAPAAPRPHGPPMAWILALAIAGLAGFLVGHAGSDDMVSDWAGLSVGLLIVIVAAAGFEFGRRAAAPIVMLDSALLERLLHSSKDKR